MMQIGARDDRRTIRSPVSGPNMVPRVYAEYRDPDAVQADQPAPAQRAAADRGRTRAAGARDLGRVRRRADGRHCSVCSAPARQMLAAAALAAVAAMLAAGLFEYNFGDSEFLMMFLVLVTLPFAAARDAGSELLPADRALTARAPRLVGALRAARTCWSSATRCSTGSSSGASPASRLKRPCRSCVRSRDAAASAARPTSRTTSPRSAASATLVAVTGTDEAAATLAQACRDAGIAPSLAGDPARRPRPRCASSPIATSRWRASTTRRDTRSTATSNSASSPSAAARAARRQRSSCPTT